jgi:uncharacterized protein (DUF58 family)
MRLTLRDWRLPLLVLAGLIFAWLAGGRFPYFLLWLGLGTGVGALIWTHHSLHKIIGDLRANKAAAAVGESVEFTLRLENEGLLPVPWIEADDLTPPHLVAAEAPRQATNLAILGNRILTFRLTPKRRGYYRVGPIRLRVGDPFGLAQGERVMESKVTLTVYPKIHPIDGFHLPLGLPFGPVRTRERAFEDPSNQAEIRPYRPGDNPRQIHWKTTARRGELMLREYELNAATNLLLVPDLSADGHVGGSASNDSAEMAIELAASLAAWGLKQKIEVGLVSHGAERIVTQPGRGERAFREVLEGLIRAEATGALPLARLLERESALFATRATLAVITAHIDHDLAEVLLRLRSRHPLMLVWLDPGSFPGGQPAPEAVPILHLLSRRGVTVYALPADADLRQLNQYRLGLHEGVNAR